MARRKNKLPAEELSFLKLKNTDEEACKKFERDCNIRNLRPDSIMFYKTRLSITRTTLDEISINKEIVELTQKDIEDMIIYLKEKIKIVSINTRIRGLKSFFSFLHKEKLVRPNPMKNIKQLRDRRRIIETLEDKDIENIAAYIKEQKTFVGIRDYNILLIMIDTGIR
ncbi:tyrosine-type recombinase/integrase [Bacillus sp. FSL K6-3431]|uniref:tyrosine-type recombinase/integrase n=1 Tax=Bacillus sp. FSL K6-3431 TaxID=2921500 RepID=UPI0030FC01F5